MSDNNTPLTDTDLTDLLATGDGSASAIQREILAAIPDNDMRLEWRDPRHIAANDLNWKTHPSLQREAYSDFLHEVGWVGALLLNDMTDRLMDGHMRLQDALEKNLERVPVLVISVPPEIEVKILALLDKIGSMYSARRKAMDQLASLVETRSRNLQAILDAGDEKPTLDDEEDEFGTAVKAQAAVDMGNLPPGGISLVLGESYNYIVLLFRTELDFTSAQDHFGIEKTRCAFNSGVGIGRVVDGSAYLRRIMSQSSPSAAIRAVHEEEE